MYSGPSGGSVCPSSPRVALHRVTDICITFSLFADDVVDENPTDTFAEHCAAGVLIKHAPCLSAGHEHAYDRHANVRPCHVHHDQLGETVFSQPLQQEADVVVDMVMLIGGDRCKIDLLTSAEKLLRVKGWRITNDAVEVLSAALDVADAALRGFGDRA